MNKPSSFSEYDLSRLRNEAYFSSLVLLAGQKGQLSSSDMQAMQAALVGLLGELSVRLNRGRSSSVRTETANELFESVCFVIGVHLKTFDTPENAVQALKTESVQALYEAGQKRIAHKLLLCRAMHRRLCSRLFPTSNVFYRATAVEGINGFFRLYNPRFAAHELHITADYPVALGRPVLAGIEFIEQYLRCLEAENAFMNGFAPETVHRLLDACLPGYAEIPMNLFEPLFTAALGLVCVGREPQGLPLKASELPLLEKRLGTDPEPVLQAAFGQAMDLLACSDIVRDYGRLCLPKLCAEVKTAKRLGTLRQAFWIAT